MVKILSNQSEKNEHEQVSMTVPIIKNKLEKYVKKWKPIEIEKIVTYLKDWNTNSKNSYVCSMILDSLFQVQGYQKLMSLSSFVSSLPAIISYSERHYQRINKLHESIYLTDYILSMMTMLPTNTSTDYIGDSQNMKAINNNGNDDTMVNNNNKQQKNKRKLFESDSSLEKGNKTSKRTTNKPIIFA